MVTTGPQDLAAERRREGRALLLFLLVTFGWSWALWAGRAGREVSDPSFAPALLLGSFGPALGALCARASQGRAPLRAWAWSLVRFRAGWRAWGTVLFLLPLLGLAAVTLLQVPSPIGWAKAAVTLVAMMPINAVLGGIVFGSGPPGEEPGWRGFLQPVLEPRLGAFAPAVVGLVWTLWHLPLSGSVEFRVGLASWPEWLLGYALSLVAMSYALAAVMRWTAGAIPLAILLHAVMNVAADTLARLWPMSGPEPFFWTFVGVLCLFALIVAGPRPRRGRAADPGAPGPLPGT